LVAAAGGGGGAATGAGSSSDGPFAVAAQSRSGSDSVAASAAGGAQSWAAELSQLRSLLETPTRTHAGQPQHKRTLSWLSLCSYCCTWNGFTAPVLAVQSVQLVILYQSSQAAM
jgi:hypothetical protein